MSIELAAAAVAVLAPYLTEAGKEAAKTVGKETAEGGDQVEAQEHAQHQQLALGEVDDLHDPEDQPEPDAHEAVEAADDETGGEGIHQVLDQGVVHRASRTPGAFALVRWASGLSPHIGDGAASGWRAGEFGAGRKAQARVPTPLPPAGEVAAPLRGG